MAEMNEAFPGLNRLDNLRYKNIMFLDQVIFQREIVLLRSGGRLYFVELFDLNCFINKIVLILIKCIMP